MAFPENSVALKLDFALDFVLFIFSMVSLITLATQLTNASGYCMLFFNIWNVKKNGTCSFSIASGALTTVAAVSPLRNGLDDLEQQQELQDPQYVCRLMALLSISTAVVVDLGIKKFCDNTPACRNVDQIPGIDEIYAGIVCSSLAGICFASYAICELFHYRRRQ